MGKILRLRRPPLLLLPDVAVFNELVGELLLDDELSVDADAVEITELCTEFDETAGIEFIDDVAEFVGCDLHSSSTKYRINFTPDDIW